MCIVDLLRRRHHHGVLRLLLVSFLATAISACEKELPSGVQSAGGCIGTNAVGFKITAGNNLRFAVPVHSVRGASSSFSLGKTTAVQNEQINIVARQAESRVRPEDPGYFYVDIYSTTLALPGDFRFTLPISSESESDACAGGSANWEFDVRVFAPRRLNQVEIDEVPSEDGIPLLIYQHRDFLLRSDENRLRTAYMVGLQEFLSRLQLRDSRHMRRVMGSYYSDGAGNIGRFGNFALGMDWAPMPYGVVLFASGGSMFGVDASGDGVIDVAFGGRRSHEGRFARLWIETNAFGERFYECWFSGQELTPELIREIARATELESEGPCEGIAGGDDSGAGVGGIGLPGADLIGPPDCADVPGPGDITTDTSSTPTVEDLLGPEPTDEEFEALIDEILTATEDLEIESLINEALREPPRSGEGGGSGILDGAAQQLESMTTIFEAEGANTFSRMRVSPGTDEGIGGMLIFEGCWPGPCTPEIEDDEEDPFEGDMPGHSPPIGPTGQPAPDFQDPRCAGIRTDAARGTLFTNPHFCSGSTMLECLRRQEDSIYDITGGNCRREEGPDGGLHLACGNNDEYHSPCDPSPDDPAGRRCESTCGPGDLFCRNSVRGTAPPFVSMTPMAGLLHILCRADCPTEPRY